MPRLTQFIKSIIPAITTVSPTDDGALYVCYNTSSGPKQTLLELTDYEKATGQSKRIQGLRDTIVAQA